MPDVIVFAIRRIQFSFPGNIIVQPRTSLDARLQRIGRLSRLFCLIFCQSNEGDNLEKVPLLLDWAFSDTSSKRGVNSANINT